MAFVADGNVIAREIAEVLHDTDLPSIGASARPTRDGPLDLAAIVESAVEVVQPAASAKDIRLSTDIQARPAMTIGDPDRLQQVVWNLLFNAVKFTATGVTIRLTAHAVLRKAPSRLASSRELNGVLRLPQREPLYAATTPLEPRGPETIDSTVASA
jgi:K+-sensing histidine kinase KdpD